MTDQLVPSAAAAASDELVWRQVTDALWVASADGTFIGSIERIEDRYIAVDDRGTPLGVNGSLASAQERFAGLEPSPVPARRRFGLRRWATRRRAG